MLKLACVVPDDCAGSMLWQLRPNTKSPAGALVTVIDPAAGTAPAQPGIPPDAVQPVEYAEVQDMVSLCPATSVLGLKEIAAVGTAAGLTVNVMGAELSLSPFRN